MRVTIADRVGRVDRAAWDALVGEGTPFLEWDFLTALEESGCVGGATGWRPRPVLAWDGDRLVGAVPAYEKDHSYGEYVYDWQIASWARARGRRWYPKLVVASPFNPVVGSRVLVAADADRNAVIEALWSGLASAKVAGIHVLFPDARDAADLVARGGAERLQYQFHWQNHGFATFEAWLATLPSKRRNTIRRERKEVASLRIEVQQGAASPGEAWDFYRSTYLRHTGDEGYLNAAFFEILCARWAHRLHTVRAFDGPATLAGTFNVRKGDRLYGRWWGCRREVPFLHFEVAVYAPVQWCIENGIAAFEPGHGGEHKRQRGFTPVLTRSVHWHREADVHAAVADFYRREAEVVRGAVG